MDKNLRNDEVIRISNEILKQKNYNISLYDLIKKMIKKNKRVQAIVRKDNCL